MYCYKCGEKLDKEVSFCPTCGADLRTAAENNVSKQNSTAADGELKAAVENFIGGNVNAFDEVYAKSNRYIYYTILKTVSNKDAAEDILQETYLEIYKNLHSLKNTDAFKGWAAKVAQSKISRYFNKNKEVLFYSEEDMDDTIESMPEDDEDVLPETAMQDKETARLVLEIIDTLPPAQREAIVAFYYNQMSINDIARVMEMPENTVKTNLRRGKERIKTGVLELEKEHGTKLYGVIPFSVALLFIFGQEAKACTLPVGTFAKIMASAGAGGAAAGTGGTVAGAGESIVGADAGVASAAVGSTGASAGMTAGAAASTGFGIKAALIAAAAVFVIGGTAAIGIVTSAIIEKSKDVSQIEEFQEEPENEPEADLEDIPEEREDESSEPEKDKTEEEAEVENDQEESEEDDESEIMDDEDESVNEEEPEPEEAIDASKLYGEWVLPGFDREYMVFSENGTVEGYDYYDNRFEVKGDKLYIYDTPFGGDVVFDIVQLTDDQMGLKREGDDYVEYSYKSGSTSNNTDSKLVTKYLSEVWVAKDTGGLSDSVAGGFHFGSDGDMEWYYGPPDNMGESWTMAMTNVLGPYSAENGKITIKGTGQTLSYSIGSDGVLHIHYDDSGKDMDYEKRSTGY